MFSIKNISIIIIFGFLNLLHLESFGESIDSDDIQNKINKFKREGKYNEAILFILDFLESDQSRSFQTEYYSKIELGNLLWIIGQFEECLYLLNRIENDLLDLDEPLLKGRLNQEFAQLYNQLGLSELVLLHNKNAIDYVELEPDSPTKQIRINYYNFTRSKFFEKLGMYDSAYFYSSKVFGLNENNYYELGYLLTHFTLYKPNRDSADFFYNKTIERISLDKDPVNTRFWLMVAAGRYDLDRGNFESAKNHAELAEQLATTLDRFPIYETSYNLFLDYYKRVGDEKGVFNYLEKINDLRYRKLSINSFKLTNETASRLKVYLAKIPVEDNSIYRFWIIFISLVSGMMIIYIFIVKNKGKQKLRNLEEDVKNIADEKSQLERRVADGLNDLLLSAQNNDPSFLAKFQEIYEELWEKLEDIEPKLSIDELKLCAMLYLNFSSKEISSYTFVQHKTIQMKKYRLRKKLGVNPNTDLYDWVKNL
ncbi:hypothetical protein ACFOUP_11145 [Belliella kenyensis]|uniref:HTH luxR-type domain-containing protein n=1 Tax=Belliella kenyensis TaxID=1472724 RepID=A0ABV8EMM6_9BACT|nr:hypothetical protein [Belliella kenyensis]MCH7403727.1 hypothetical protein [Belliella kenyensis]MDN3602484.1 hypothetical protein [Belliella kenyensis]